MHNLHAKMIRNWQKTIGYCTQRMKRL